MRINIVEAIPKDRRGRKSKYISVIQDFIESDGNFGEFDECPPTYAGALNSLACKNDLPVHFVTRAGRVFVEKITTE